MKWFTFCGYDGNNNLILHIQCYNANVAWDVARAYFSSGSPDYAFEGKIEDLLDVPTKEITYGD
jgi:hypothetical protein